MVVAASGPKLVQFLDIERTWPVLYPRHRQPQSPRRRALWIILLAVLAIGSPVALSLNASATTVPTPPAPTAAPTGCEAYAFVNRSGIGYNDCSSTRQLTDTGVAGADDQPAVSPDGAKVAFRRIGAGNHSEIYTVPTTGGVATQATHFGGYASDPTWSPDSKQIAFTELTTEDDATNIIYRVNANGTGLATVKSGAQSDSPAWCHDGKMAVVVDGAIATMNGADGSSETPVIAENARELAWTPDCRYIVYDSTTTAASGDTETRIKTVPAAGGSSVQLTTGTGGLDLSPSISPKWVLAYGRSSGTGSAGTLAQWLGTATAAALPSASSYEDFAYRPSAAGTASPAPAKFPINVSGGIPSDCPAAKLFGVRGSLEQWNDSSGLGRTISTYRDQLSKKLPGLSAEPLSYSAVPVDIARTRYPESYTSSVRKGSDALLKQVRQFISSCPSTYVIFAGHGHGADVIQTSMPAFTKAERQHVAAVNLFGSPRFSPKQDRVTAGDFSPKLAGVYFSNPDRDDIPRGWRARTSTYCADGDPVCNFSTRNVLTCVVKLISGRCAHQLYATDGWTSRAAGATVTRWKQLPKLN